VAGEQISEVKVDVLHVAKVIKKEIIYEKEVLFVSKVYLCTPIFII
jgi:hypothetical protein